MDKFIAIDNQIELIETIVNSLNNVVKLLLEVDSTIITSPIIDTIHQILKFIDKIINLMPVLIYGNPNYIALREEIISQFKKVIDCWKNFTIEPIEFVKNWNIFVYKWNEIKGYLKELSKSQNTIFLSLN